MQLKHVVLLASLPSLFALGCATSQRPGPSETLVATVTDATRTERLIISPESEVVRTETNLEIRIDYESSVQNEVLGDPGLRYSFPGLPDQITSGLGQFYVFGRYVIVERIWEDSSATPKLKLTFEPSAPQKAKIPWNDAVKRVVEEIKKQGIGFMGYASTGDEAHESLDVLFELPDEGLYLSATINRFDGAITIEVFDARDHFWDLVKLDWIRNVGKSTVHITGSNSEFLALVNRPLSQCFHKINAQAHIVRHEDGNLTVNGDEPYDLKPEDLQTGVNCASDVLKDHPVGTFETKISAQFTPTYIAEIHDGEYIGQVVPRKWITVKDYFRTSNQDPALTQEIRKKIRQSWEPLMACSNLFMDEERDTSVHFTVVHSGEVQLTKVDYETPARTCLRNIVRTWKFSPQDVALDEHIYLEKQREP